MSDTGPLPVDPDEVGLLDSDTIIIALSAMSPAEAARWLAAHRSDLSAGATRLVDRWVADQDIPVDDGGDIESPSFDDSAEVIQYLRDLGPSEGEAWLRDHAGDLEEHVSYDVDDWVAQQGEEWSGAQATTTAVAETASTEAEAAVVSEEALGEAVDAWAEILADTAEGDVPDVGRLNAYLPPGLSTAEQEAFIAAAQEQGEEQWASAAQEEAVSGGATEEEARAAVEQRRSELTGNLDAPLWLLRFVGGGRNLTDTVKQRYLDYWNDDHGTNLTEWSQLTPILESMGSTTYTQNMTNAVLAEQQPLISHSIEIPFVNGAKRVNYTQDEMQALADMGFSPDAVTRLVRLSGLTAGRDAIEPGPNGDTLPISAIAGLLRYYGGGEEFGTYNQIGQDVNALEKSLGLRPGAYRAMNAKERRELRSRYERMNERQQSGEAARGLAAIDKIESLFKREAGLEEYGSTTGVLLAQNNYKRGLDAYNGDQYLAFIHSIDPSLAQRIAGSGGDPTKMSGADNAAALRILDRGGLTNRGSTLFERLGGTSDHVLRLLNYFDTTGAGSGGGGGAGPVRRELDPVSVKEQLEKQFSDLMLDDIPDDVVSSVYNMLQGQLDKSPEGMSFDVSARILDWVQGRPEYASLYGKKPQGMNEADYQNQFILGVHDILGAEANPEAVKAGMRENQYQTAVGRASAGQGLLTNSQLRGNWAAAKQTLDKFS